MDPAGLLMLSTRPPSVLPFWQMAKVRSVGGTRVPLAVKVRCSTALFSFAVSVAARKPSCLRRGAAIEPEARTPMLRPLPQSLSFSAWMLIARLWDTASLRAYCSIALSSSAALCSSLRSVSCLKFGMAKLA